jgi:hypothetical protein
MLHAELDLSRKKLDLRDARNRRAQKRSAIGGAISRSRNGYAMRVAGRGFARAAP